jgi:hypothetical protein
MKNRKIYKSKILKVLTVLLAFSIFSCSGLLDAENPNSLVESNLDSPSAAGPMVNGSEAAVTRALANILLPAAISSDEIVWSGSRDAWQQLNLGQLSDFENEFTDGAFAYVGEARWWSKEVIDRLEGFVADGAPVGDDLLVRAYMYGAIIHMTIGDLYDDFALSDKETSGPAVGTANMSSFYDTAIGYLDKAVALDATNKGAWGLLARAHWSKAARVKAKARDGANALINNDDANAAAAKGGDLVLVVDGTTPGVILGLAFGSEVNNRKEQRLSDLYVVNDPETGNSVFGFGEGDTVSPANSISLMDPIDGTPDMVLYDKVVEFVNSGINPDFTVSSSADMQLILAEAALAQGDMPLFATRINALRAEDGASPWVDEVTSGISAQDLLIHERRVHLFLQGRRLIDHYRFDDPSPYWLPSSNAFNAPVLFPIAITEVRANTLID